MGRGSAHPALDVFEQYTYSFLPPKQETLNDTAVRPGEQQT